METGIHDDEIIADSEEEDNGMVLTEPLNMAVHTIGPTSIPDDNYPPSEKPQASRPLTSPKDPASTVTSRPKPRPAYRKDKPVNNVPSDNTSSSGNPAMSTSTDLSSFHLDIGPSNSSIADRAKLRSRNTKTHSPATPISPDQYYASEKVMSSNDIIELSSDDDLNLFPPSKAPKKPKATAKKARTNSGSDDTFSPDKQPRPKPRLKPIPKSSKPKLVYPPSPLQSSVLQDTSSMLSSSIPGDPSQIPFRLLPSQLLLQDPSEPTTRAYDHPPIETLPNIDTDIDVPSSSPSSLFSVPSSAKRKSCYDELGLDEGVITPSPPLSSLPPSFLVDSSSADPDNVPVTTNSINASSNKPSAAKKPRKKVGIEDDGGIRTTKSKASSKAKKVSHSRVEVVIEQKKKGKDKGEVFKSREFIEDEEDEVTGDLGDHTMISTKLNSPTLINSIPSSDPQETVVVEPSKKRKPVDRDKDRPKPKKRETAKSKAKVIVSDEEEEVNITPVTPSRPAQKNGKRKRDSSVEAKKNHKTISDAISDDKDHLETNHEDPTTSKENVEPTSKPSFKTTETSTPLNNTKEMIPSLFSRYTIAPKTKPVPLSDLIRRVNSMPGSPFQSPAPRSLSSSTTRLSGTAYSPYAKSSRMALSRIAPLHPNRRTPPPPLPPPPPRKKTKKEIEREEKWEEELVESVGGITEWACMTDMERKELRRAKREREMSGWEE